MLALPILYQSSSSSLRQDPTTPSIAFPNTTLKRTQAPLWSLSTCITRYARPPFSTQSSSTPAPLEGKGGSHYMRPCAPPSALLVVAASDNSVSLLNCSNGTCTTTHMGVHFCYIAVYSTAVFIHFFLEGNYIARTNHCAANFAHDHPSASNPSFQCKHIGLVAGACRYF